MSRLLQKEPRASLKRVNHGHMGETQAVRRSCAQRSHTFRAACGGLSGLFMRSGKWAEVLLGERRCGPHAACWGPRSPVQPLGLRLGPGLRQAPLWALRTNSAGWGAFRAGTIARGHSGCWSRKGFIVDNCLQHCSPGLALTIPCMPTLGSWVPLQSPGYEGRCSVASLAALAPGSSKGSLIHGSATGAEGHREGVPGHHGADPARGGPTWL